MSTLNQIDRIKAAACHPENWKEIKRKVKQSHSPLASLAASLPTPLRRKA